MFLRCKAQSAAKASLKQTIRPFEVSFFMGDESRISFVSLDFEKENFDGNS